VGVHAGSGPAACAAALERAVRRTLASAGCRRGEISVALLDDVEITELNRRYLRKDRPTDVLAFSLGEPGDVVGDVYIGFEQAARQAENLGVATCEELVRLAVHGTLHVLGHDHPEGPERDTSEMFRLQERIVRESMEALDGG
jgi:probable rRNA maturation factor